MGMALVAGFIMTWRSPKKNVCSRKQRNESCVDAASYVFVKCDAAFPLY